MAYQDLKSYQNALIIHDFTVEFIKKYIPFNSRTCDQMAQAARSGKQNIVEGSSEKASSKGEIKLLGVARASFQELLEDYTDFLRQKGLALWGKDSPQAVAVRQLAYKTDKTYTTYKAYLAYLASPEGAGNAMVCLINQTNFLLDRQIKALEQRFIKQGGYTERLFKQRMEERKKQIYRNSMWGL